jgi:hypothetical protein
VKRPAARPDVERQLDGLPGAVLTAPAASTCFVLVDGIAVRVRAVSAGLVPGDAVELCHDGSADRARLSAFRRGEGPGHTVVAMSEGGMQ